MSLNSINWKAEALEFAKQHDQNRDSSVAIIEKVMKKGAELVVCETIALVQIASSDLRAAHNTSAPHREIKKHIETP